MICAEFDRTRSAAVGGVYQYDTGQRLVMRGLPSPNELTGEDELLSGGLVTVQAQFGFTGDSQTQMRLAIWDEERDAWTVNVPDEYLTRSRDVHVYVYLYYGADGTGERAKTAYEAVFRPIARPAPSGTVTEDQLEQWDALKAEIEISLSKVDAAIDHAQTAADETNAAADAAQDAAQSAESAAQAAGAATGSLAAAGGGLITQAAGSSLAVSAAATASLSGGKLTIGSPKGSTGAKGETGDTGPADVAFSYDSSTGTLTITTT